MAWMNCTDISPIRSNSTPCMRIAKASRNPNSKQANSTGTGRHLPKIMAASAMKPLPAVISRKKPAPCPVDR